MVTKIVAVRAVYFSIGPFCTEFRCQQLCDDEVFGIRARKMGPRQTHRNGHESGRRELELGISRSAHSAQNFGANNFGTMTFLESGSENRPSWSGDGPSRWTFQAGHLQAVPSRKRLSARRLE